MSKNGWVACVIVVIVFSCILVACLGLSLLGVAGYLTISPKITWSIPLQPSGVESPTPSPVVVRPTLAPTATLPADSSPHAPGVLPEPVQVPTDTLHILENTTIPINDPLDLARRLLDIDDLSPTLPPPVSPYKIGAQQSFWAGNSEDENFLVPATLQYITEHAYFWIENGVRYRQEDLSTLADSFENQIYPTNRAFFGSEWTPGVDGDPHIYIVYARGIGDEVAGYFSSPDEYPPQVNHFSNAHEMFLFNADNSPLDDVYTFGVLAHEFQHMIHWYQDRNEASWLGEGFSELAVLLNGFYSGGFDALYTSNPDIQLNNWPDDSQGDSTPHYGSSFLFVTYFLDRFGEAAARALVANQDNDLSGVDSTLQKISAIDPLTALPITADQFFLDWAITNYLMDARVGDGRYAYTSYDAAPPVDPSQSFTRCPVDTVTNDVHQYGVDYISISCKGSLRLYFEGSVQTPLLPADPHSGQYALWANKNDESDTILTQAFDFSNHSGPLSLSYWTWYDIENGWDYAYLEASLDGQDWQILTTPSGTDFDPQGTSFGWGYTGFSGRRSAPIWIKETVDLSPFAGQKVSLRFEYVTDSNLTGEGFLVDDISIPEIGYFADFESGFAGWQAEGWARIQNILPQNYQLALILVGEDTYVQYVNLNPDNTAEIPLTIGDGTDEVILLVAGTTRYTRQLAPYRFSVSYTGQ